MPKEHYRQRLKGKLGIAFGGKLVEIVPRLLVHPNTISNLCRVLLCCSLIFDTEHLRSVSAGLIRAVVF